MKTLVKSLLVAFTLGLVSSASSFAEDTPGIRPAAVASYKTGIYSTVTGQLNVALDKETGSTVDISLKNEDGTVLYTKHLGKNERNYRVRLNLSELADGTYQLAITNGVETTTQAVTLRTNYPVKPERVVKIQAITE